MPESTTLSDEDRAAIRRALALAGGGRGRVSPNPLVGAVLVRDGRTVGEGFHQRLGGLHAEAAALEDCRARGEDPRGATMYVTLEPCAHHGRQPPCAEAIAAAGIARVVVASDDPSDHAGGRGPAILEAAGIEVTRADGAEAAQARRLNQPFRKRARTGRPLVTLKSAISLDGRTATASGDSRWISGEASRRLVHRWRAEADAVAVGIGTALADDPLLTAREVEVARAPARVVFDSAARLPLDSRLVETVGEAPLLVIVAEGAAGDRVAALERAGAEPIACPGAGAEQVPAALAVLGDRGVSALLLEGGAGLTGSFLDAGEVDELRLFVAPILLGGSAARPLAAGAGAGRIDQALRARTLDCEPCGEDLLVTARLREW
jgi:diaminohydroxyphosphoribosylaminopyrimidine deaminase / 5-amino-6-(5-phosphoribosylamino)uracil reductase